MVGCTAVCAQQPVVWPWVHPQHNRCMLLAPPLLLFADVTLCRAVDLALSVGIFPYVLKLLQTQSQVCCR
jgi:hypothetical protein